MIDRKMLHDAIMHAFDSGRDYARVVADHPDRQANILKRVTDSVEYWAKQLEAGDELSAKPKSP